MEVLADKEEEVLLQACINNIGGTVKSLLNQFTRQINLEFLTTPKISRSNVGFNLVLQIFNSFDFSQT